jgi:hypothetical protein
MPEQRRECSRTGLNKGDNTISMEDNGTIQKIEEGFSTLVQVLEKKHEENEQGARVINEKSATLMDRMASLAAPLVPKVGLEMIRSGTQDGQGGELFGVEYFKGRMLLLGKTDPVPFRPDLPSKSVTDQFCVLGEDGRFYEIMYSLEGGRVDAFQAAIEPAVIMEVYGYEVMFMLYRALRDFNAVEEELIAALERVLTFIDAKKE